MKNNNKKNDALKASDTKNNVIDSQHQPAHLSVLTSDKSSLNKRIALTDGTLFKKANGSLSKGEVNVVDINNLLELKYVIEGIKQNQALAIGVP